METRQVAAGVCALLAALAGGCWSSGSGGGPALRPADFASQPGGTTGAGGAPSPAGQQAMKPVEQAPKAAPPKVAAAPAKPMETQLLPAPSAHEVVAVVGSPEVIGDVEEVGLPVLVDAKIGDVNNRALYASGFLEPMEAALRAKAVELVKAGGNDPAQVRRQWNQYAIEQIGGALQRFIRDEIFRAEGLSALKPEQRAGLAGFMNRLRQEEIRKNEGLQELTEQQIAKQTGGKSLDDYMRQREQIELIRYQFYQQIDRKIQVAWRDIKQQYERDFLKYNPDPKAFLRMIIVSESGGESVKEITDGLAQGKEFAELAASNANIYKRSEGGLQIVAFKGDLSQATVINFKPVNDAAVKLSPGQVAGPIKFDGRVAWVKLERIDQPSMSLYDAQLAIENDLFSQRQEKAITQYQFKLQDRASLTDIEEMGQRVLQYARERCLEPVIRAGAAGAGSSGAGAVSNVEPKTN